MSWTNLVGPIKEVVPTINDKLTLNNILHVLQDTQEPNNHSQYPNHELEFFFSDVVSQQHAWQGLHAVEDLQPHA